MNPASTLPPADQASEVGVEMIILSFGSGMNLESSDPKYQAVYKEVADYANRSTAIGGYSLLASRMGTSADDCKGPVIVSAMASCHAWDPVGGSTIWRRLNRL